MIDMGPEFIIIPEFIVAKFTLFSVANDVGAGGSSWEVKVA